MLQIFQNPAFFGYAPALNDVIGIFHDAPKIERNSAKAGSKTINSWHRANSYPLTCGTWRYSFLGIFRRLFTKFSFGLPISPEAPLLSPNIKTLRHFPFMIL